jgi:hypothetical protein
MLRYRTEWFAILFLSLFLTSIADVHSCGFETNSEIIFEEVYRITSWRTPLPMIAPV